ncbi:AraD1 family protein [Roseobacter weihaiensis]|uniref:AraD1 family protein n=1 Tax=Roseobacter weihaiensis TaxID=2763262 RepID=UPI0029CAB5E5|nr:AraD1 family protein [Roseobacter sp. H9]
MAIDPTMRLVQLRRRDGTNTVAVVQGDRLALLDDAPNVETLARAAMGTGAPLAEAAADRLTEATEDYATALAEGRIAPPISHAEPARLRITGTGLTHLGSADTRDAMHADTTADAPMTDSMRMFRAGLEGGKPAAGEVGAQPEWFYKGDGSILAAPEAPLVMPGFSLDGGEEPEIAGIYLIADDGTPLRLGFALGNEFSDHVTERQNYLLLAHSKLRACAIGPELRLGALPERVEGTSRILRGNQTLWEKPFLSGEAHMSHSLANLEHHHFKYPLHRQPGDVHVHFFGTATLSFADGICPEEGDVFEIAATGFGRPLRNILRRAPEEGPVRVRQI